MSEVQKIISELLPCPMCTSTDFRHSDIHCGTGHGVVVRYWVRCLDCGASIIADTQLEADTLWNISASNTAEYQPELTNFKKPLLQRYGESCDYDHEMEPQDKGEYVLYGDHCFYARSLKDELAALREELANAERRNVDQSNYLRECQKRINVNQHHAFCLALDDFINSPQASRAASGASE